MTFHPLAPAPADPTNRRSQADRRARSRSALLESTARGLSRYGYGNLALEQVAREAGYTRGALYHQFKDKQELTLAAFAWILETWDREVATLVEAEPEPLAALLALARGHAIFCRRDIARVAAALRLEFAGQEHPVGRAVEEAYQVLIELCVGLIRAGRRAGTIPAGPPADTVGLAFIGAVEGATIALSGRTPDDVVLTARIARGVLGLAPKGDVLSQKSP